MKMRAAVLEEFGQPLAIEEVELAEPRAGEVLVRLVACGVCHTDLYTASGGDPSGYSPTVLGHEGGGVGEAVGPGVSSLAVGGQVGTLFSPQCREGGLWGGGFPRGGGATGWPRCPPPGAGGVCTEGGERRPSAGPPGSRKKGPPCGTAPPASLARVSRSATSWARQPSPSTRSCRR